MKKVLMNNGLSIPIRGIGTWRITGQENVSNSIRCAISNGYRHIDTAYVYENEKEIGNVLQEIFSEGTVKREDLFITSKLWNSFHDNPSQGLENTLKDLKIDYLDLYLIHWPVNFKNNDGATIRNEKGEPVLQSFNLKELWEKMEIFVYSEKVKSIGVSNFGITNLRSLLSYAKIKPVINQFELNPYFQQKELVKFCKSNDIVVVSYSSLGSLFDKSLPNLIANEILKNIAKIHNTTVPSVVLNWLCSRGIVVIPKSTKEERIKENFSEIQLSEAEIAQIESIKTIHRFVDPVFFGPGRFL